MTQFLIYKILLLFDKELVSKPFSLLTKLIDNTMMQTQNTKNNSKLYASMTAYQNRLLNELDEVNSYFADGQGTTTVSFLDKRGQVICSYSKTSTYTTRSGYHRIKMAHNDFINYVIRWNGNLNAAKVKVNSPFVVGGAATRKMTVQVVTEVPVQYA